MKKMIVAAFAAIAFASLAAPIPQASQAWVDMKLEQMRQRILAEVSSVGTDTNSSETTTISTGVAGSMAEVSAISDVLLTVATSPQVPTNGVPFYTAGSCSSSLTNFITSGYVLSQTASNVFSNAGVILTEGAATNTISVGGAYTLYAPSGRTMYEDSSDNFAFFFKGYHVEE